MEGILLAAWVDRVAPAQPLQALTRGKQGPGGTARPLGPPEDRRAMHHWCSRKTREGLTTVMRPGQIQRALQLPPPAQALGGRNTERREEARRAGKGGAGSAVVGWGSPTEPAGGRSSALPSSRCGERPRSRALSREGDLQGPDLACLP